MKEIIIKPKKKYTHKQLLAAYSNGVKQGILQREKQKYTIKDIEEAFDAGMGAALDSCSLYEQFYEGDYEKRRKEWIKKFTNK